MLHIQGPDDIVATPSREEADRVAAGRDTFWAAHTAKCRAEIAAEGKDPGNYPSIIVVVAEWDGSADDHAESVPLCWPDYAEWAASLPPGKTTA